MARFRAIYSLLLLFLIFSINNPTVTLALLGDVMLGRGVAASNQHLENALKPISSQLIYADIAVANLESPITELPLLATNLNGIPGHHQLSNNNNYTYDLRSSPSSLVALSSVGIDLVSISNNHIYDCGYQGIEDTRAALRTKGILPIGPEGNIVYQEVNGILLAFIGYDDNTQQNQFERILRAVQIADGAKAFTIVSVHWGEEYRSLPTVRQREIAQALADSGASLIWGHHPHVLQPIEWIYSQRSSNSTLVIYSLGNALFDQYMIPDTQKGALILLDINANGINQIRGIPFIMHVWRGEIGLADVNTALLITDRLGIGNRSKK